MATEGVLLGQLLRLREPWVVREWRFDAVKRRLDVRIATEVPRGWFGRPKADAAEQPAVAWRHLDVLGWRCFVHVHAPPHADLSGHPWAGAPDQPFTHAMARTVFNLLNEGVSLEGICGLCSITLDELWRFKFALESGRTGLQAVAPGRPAATPPKPPLAAKPDATVSTVSPAPAPAPAHATAPQGTDEAATAGVPDLSNPVWTALVSGAITPDIRVLALKLLLTRVRTQMNVIHDEEVRMLRMRELHRYFVKNARMLTHELAQLREAVL